MSNKKILTIGLPVFNGEKFLRRRLENILSQTFEDFLLVISDNNSNDKTFDICMEFQRLDKRITYVKQNFNQPIPNMHTLLNNSNTKYFVWAAIDDFWSTNFLENNIKILEDKPGIIGSIGAVYFFEDYDEFNINQFDTDSYNLIHVKTTSGTYENKVSKFMNFNQTSALYSVFRTGILKSSVVQKLNFLKKTLDPIAAWDTALIFRVLKHGDLHVNNNSSFFKYTKGITGVSNYDSVDYILNVRKKSIVEAFILYLPFTLVSLKTMGIRIFLKNIKWFLLLNFRTGRRVFKNLFRLEH